MAPTAPIEADELADLRDALKVSAGYSQAAAVLFDAHLEDEEYREARQILALLQEHLAGPEVAVKQLQYACKTGDTDAAVQAFAPNAVIPRRCRTGSMCVCSR